MAKKPAKTPRRKVTARTTFTVPLPLLGSYVIPPARYAALLAYHDKLKPSLENLITLRQEAQTVVDKGKPLSAAQSQALYAAELEIHSLTNDMLFYMRKM